MNSAESTLKLQHFAEIATELAKRSPSRPHVFGCAPPIWKPQCWPAMIRAMPPTPRAKREELLTVMERRRAASDTFAWAVPAVAIASQAFLVTIALDGGASAARRLIASGAAILTLVGAMHLFWKQAFAHALYEAVIRRERHALGLAQVDRNSLLRGADGLQQRFQDEWLERRSSQLVRTDGPDWYYQPKWLIRRRATRVWLWIFGLLLALDAVLFVWARYDWDPFDWFGSDFNDRRGRFPFGDD
jgi:hypothetical protein